MALWRTTNLELVVNWLSLKAAINTILRKECGTNKKSLILGAFAAGVLLLSAAIPSQAVAIVLQTAAGSDGNQAYSGVGVKFSVNDTISVTHLGIYDADPTGFSATVNRPLTAVLFNSAGSTVASEIFYDVSPGTLENQYRFKSIVPVYLTPGDYTLAGYGWNNTDQEHNCNISGGCETFNDGSGLLSYVGSLWGGGSDDPNVVPTNGLVGNTNYFSGANMKYEAVPEPGAIAIFGFGLAGLGLMRRRKRVAA